MRYPRFIRETIAALCEKCEEFKTRVKQWPIERWILDNIFVPYYIDGWYRTYNQTNPDLLKIEVLREHVKWWRRERKELEFFWHNENATPAGRCVLCPFYKEEHNALFKEAFPQAEHDLEYYIMNIHHNWRFEIEDRIRELIF